MIDEWITEQELRPILDNLLTRHIRPKLEALNLSASGEWLNSLNYEIQGDQIALTAANYTSYIEYGRPPGEMPPVDQLTNWAQQRLGLSGNQAQQAAWAIARKIEQEGTDTYKENKESSIAEVLNDPQITQILSQQIEELLSKKLETRLGEVLREVRA